MKIKLAIFLLLFVSKAIPCYDDEGCKKGYRCVGLYGDNALEGICTEHSKNYVKEVTKEDPNFCYEDKDCDIGEQCVKNESGNFCKIDEKLIN
jgi:hypothetical protein